MNDWLILLCVYVGGAALVAIRVGWIIRYRLDKYDKMFCDAEKDKWLFSMFWPILLLLSPKALLNPSFKGDEWKAGRAEKERWLDRIAANLPACGALIRYSPKRDELGDCDSEFVFETAVLEAIMTKRLAELPENQQGRFPDFLKWFHQCDPSISEPTEVPEIWNEGFLNIAIGMMDRGLGQVKCGTCNKVIQHEDITFSGSKFPVTSGWVFRGWHCPQGHKLLTKESMHFYCGR